MSKHSKKFRFPSVEEALKFYEIVGDCHIWKGSVGNGYGIFYIRGRTYRAHRASYEYRNGPIPDKLFICHKCNTKQCINPEHLYAGTSSDNAKDRSEDYWYQEKISPPLKINHESIQNVKKTIGIKKFNMIFNQNHYIELKMMSLLTNSTMSNFIRIAINEKIKKIKEKGNLPPHEQT